MIKKEKLPVLLIIGGPTASGKSALAEQYAYQYDLPIISADSRQIYRGFDIGTAKPPPGILSALRYEMIDILHPEEAYSAGKFAERAAHLINVKYRNESAIIITGGTGFYISALFDGLAQIPAIEPETDRKWNEMFESKGISKIQEIIRSIDPKFPEQGDMSNPQRLLRAAKVADQTGRSIYDYIPQSLLKEDYPTGWFALHHDRKVLYERIDQRVDQMFRDGLVEEVRQLLPYRDCQAMQTVGYRELLPWFDDQNNLPDVISKIKQHSRNYAKRQLTWMRRQTQWQWITPGEKYKVAAWLEKHMK